VGRSTSIEAGQSAGNEQAGVLAALQSAVSRDAKLVVLHSSLPELRPPQANLKWSVLGAVRAIVDSGITVAIPAFTFSFCKGTPHHHRNPSETGVLADWMMQLRGARRTHHPIYSFVVCGPLSSKVQACVNSTTFGADSTFALFEDLDAAIVMLGSSWHNCTQFHRYEEEAHVPYRRYRSFEGAADFGDGAKTTTVSMFVRDLAIDAENDWSRLELALRSKGAIKSVPLWRGVVEKAACREIAQIARSQLAADPFAMVHNAPSVSYACAQAENRATRPPLRIALLGSANLEILKTHFASAADELIRDQSVEIHTVPFGQLMLEVADPRSGLYKFDADFTVFCDRIEDITGVAHIDMCPPDTVMDRIRQYAGAISAYRAKSRGWIVINRFIASWPSLSGQPLAAIEELAAAGNAALSEAHVGAGNVHFVDLRSVTDSGTSGVLHDPRLWFLGRFPFSDEAARTLATHYCGLVLAATGRTARVLALDLDNTLWGGVLGEDGLAGIAIGGDYPGNAYAAFQRGLKLLSERGIALALLSKNDEDLALEALTGLPAMVLCKDDFVARRINWAPKWKNILEVCEDLSLGLENALFVDDNPAEREQMRRNQPAVKVHHLPEDPSLYLQSLLTSPWLTCLSVTAEDRKRVAGLRQRSSLLEAKAQTGANVEDFYASLNTVIHMQQFVPGNAARALQLLQKTNQFNTTTRRYGLAEIEAILADGGEVFVIGLRDRYSEFENIGVAICRWNQPRHGCGLIDSYLLSCRVLGRGIEAGILQWILARARRKGAGSVAGELVETPRNTPARSVFVEAGFKADQENPGHWVFDLHTQSEALPPWLTFVDGSAADEPGGEHAV
jgi:FkbH-like protein